MVRPQRADTATPGNVYVVLDRSGSMDLNGKWAAAKLAVNEMVGLYSDRIRFGLMLFPRAGTGSNSCYAGQQTVAFPTTPGANATDISDALNSNGPNNGNTPTMETLNGVSANIATLGLNNAAAQNVVLLITDGQPNCSDNEDTGVGTISALRNLHDNKGVSVFVVGFGSGIDPYILNNMATAGGEPRPGTTRYYRADDEAGLQEVLSSIGTAVTGCRYLVGDSMPMDLGQVSVFVRDLPVSYDAGHTNGWDYDPATRAMTFYGPACDDPGAGVQTATPFQLRVEVPCN